MASSLPKRLVILAISLVLLLSQEMGMGMAMAKGKGKGKGKGMGKNANDVLTYHGGPLLTGTINLSVLYYGQIGRVQKNQIRAFLKSLNSNRGAQQPSVASWWSMVESYQSMANKRLNNNNNNIPRITVSVASAATDTSYSAGKIMTMDFIKLLVEKTTGGKPNTLAVIFTDRQVTVQDMCTGRCAQHGVIGNQPYVLVGNPETECPDACAWPFVSASSGPRGVILQPPSGNIGADAMILSLAAGLADAVTNPMGDGIFMLGPRHAGPLGPATACRDIFGSGAFPGYTGKVRVDPKTGGAFNFHGVSGKKFLLPAVWNPRTRQCWTPL